MWLGIDFGTSNSSAARLVGGHPHAVREPISHQPFFPSCVLLVPPNGQVGVDERLIAGVGAERRMLLFPDRFRAELKRSLGEPWPLLLGGEEVSVVRAIGSVMTALKTEADRMSGGPFPNAMLSVPVAFGAERVSQIEEAARVAGFTEVKTCLEPEAAARFHLYVAPEDAAAEELLLVYDFGGGTFDASLVRKQGGDYAILDSAGIEDCGGRDLDQELFVALCERASPALRKRLTTSAADTGAKSQALLRLRLTALERCRRIKHELSVADSSEADLGDPPELLRFTCAEFEKLVAPHLERTIDCCSALVRGQGVEWKDVTRILLVGGTTRIPYVAKTLRARFERPVYSVEDPELAVAFGASLSLKSAPAGENGKTTTNPSDASVSLQAAIEAAAAGDTIRVAPGTYREALHIDKTLTLVAENSASGERAVIESDDKPALTAKGDGVRISGLAFHALNAPASVSVEGGKVELENCELWGGKDACLVVRGGATIVARRNRIHDGLKHGVRIEGGATGSIENNDIAGNKEAGLAISVPGPLAVTENRFSRNVTGVFFLEAGPSVVLRGNEAFENISGIDVNGPLSAPTVHENRLHGNATGLRFSRLARGLCERNDIAGNREFGIALRGGVGSSPLVRANVVDGGNAVGIASDASDGLILENRITARFGVRLANGSMVVVRGNEIASEERCVEVQGTSNPTVDDNQLVARDAAAIGVFLAQAATAHVRGNSFEGPFAAFYRIMPGAKGKATDFIGNRIQIAGRAGEQFDKLAVALERGEFTTADAESIRLIRAALGADVIKNREAAIAIPVDLLKTLDLLWRLATDEPLHKRGWAHSAGSALMPNTSWAVVSPILRRLKELNL
jgi:nitrous oxidase accessory protein NosD